MVRLRVGLGPRLFLRVPDLSVCGMEPALRLEPRSHGRIAEPLAQRGKHAMRNPSDWGNPLCRPNEARQPLYAPDGEVWSRVARASIAKGTAVRVGNLRRQTRQNPLAPLVAKINDTMADLVRDRFELPSVLHRQHKQHARRLRHDPVVSSAPTR